ncbi:MAG: LytTR family DNA-binding domain-containing protein [Flavobacteriales bacterium]
MSRVPLLIKSTTGWVFVDPCKILYLRAEDKYARLHSVNGTSMVVLHSLNDLEHRLGCNERIGDFLFLRTHRSYITAIHHAVAVHGSNELELRTGERLSFSRRVWPLLQRIAGTVRATG